MRQWALVECRTRLVGETMIGDGVRDRPARSRMTSAGEGLVIEVDDKFLERVWDAERWEETSDWRVESSGGAMSCILAAGNVACDTGAFVSIRDVVDAPEDFVGFPVSASSFPPALNDTAVVTKDLEKTGLVSLLHREIE